MTCLSSFRAFRLLLVLAMLVAVSLFTTACSPAQETQVLSDIQAVVTLAGSILSIAQSFGALNSPQAVSDLNTAETFAQEYSAAASESITEYNSTDTLPVKLNKITALFLAVPAISPLQTAKVQAAVQLLTAAVQLLLAQLHSAGAVNPSALSLGSVRMEAKAVPSYFAGFLPFTVHHKLLHIQKQADANVALAGRLKAAAHLR